MSIIIKNLSTGESKSFTPTREGYMAAYAYIQSIIEAGHRAGGDVSRVYNYVN